MYLTTMNLLIDIATLTSVSSLIYIFLLVILYVFWRQNKDLSAIIWWCGFPLFRMIYSFISSDSIQYENQLFIYVGNITLILSDLFLMIGCFKFTKINVRWSYVYIYLAAFFLVSCYHYFISADLVQRTQIVVLFDIFPIIISIYALSFLENKQFFIEKIFTIFWSAFQLGIFTFWALIQFDFGNQAYGYSVIVSLFLVYLSHIFITIGLIMLTIAKRRNQLISESLRHKKLEKSLVQTLNEAQTANDEKDLFLTNMSHELRTPLNAILGFSESLKLDYYGELNKKQIEYIDNIHSGGEFLLKLITDLLHLSNIQEGKVEITPSNVNLLELIDKTTPLLNEIVGQIDVNLYVENNLNQNERKSASIYVDQIRIAQILINFVSNAVKYGDKKSDIKLSLNDLDDYFFRVSVSNKGPGINPDQYENIFKPFDRAGADKRKTDGVGVGLSIAKQLIEDMNGRINFTSQKGEGSIFWIDIPKSEQRQLI